LSVNANAIASVNTGVGYLTPQLSITNTNATVGSTTGVPSTEFYKSGRNAAQNDVIESTLYYAKDSTGTKTLFAKTEVVATNSTVGNNDGALDFYTSVNGTIGLVFRLNGADNENNSFRPLDMNGNTINTSTGNMSISAASSTGTGNITISSKGTTAIQPLIDNDITLTTTGVSGNTAINASNGGNSTSVNVAQDQFACQTTGSIGLRATGSSAISLQGQGSGGISIDAQFGGGKNHSSEFCELNRSVGTGWKYPYFKICPRPSSCIRR
jgi:hypothetical protein